MIELSHVTKVYGGTHTAVNNCSFQVEDGKITIAVGTMKDMGGNGGAPEKPDENGSGDASADTSDAESTESDSKDAESDKTDSKTDTGKERRILWIQEWH